MNSSQIKIVINLIAASCLSWSSQALANQEIDGPDLFLGIQIGEPMNSQDSEEYFERVDENNIQRFGLQYSSWGGVRNLLFTEVGMLAVEGTEDFETLAELYSIWDFVRRRDLGASPTWEMWTSRWQATLRSSRQFECTQGPRGPFPDGCLPNRSDNNGFIVSELNLTFTPDDRLAAAWFELRFPDSTAPSIEQLQELFSTTYGYEPYFVGGRRGRYRSEQKLFYEGDGISMEVTGGGGMYVYVSIRPTGRAPLGNPSVLPGTPTQLINSGLHEMRDLVNDWDQLTVQTAEAEQAEVANQSTRGLGPQ